MLTHAYLLALGLIAILTISSHMITAHISDRQKKGEEISYSIERQRTLLQQVISSADSYYRLGQKLDYDFMMQSLQEFENSHKYLTTIISKKSSFADYKSPALFRVYYHPPFNLDERITHFHNMTMEFAQYDPKDKDTKVHEKRKKLLDEMSYQASSVLKSAMDAAIESYQTETLQKGERFYNIQFSASIFILIVLAAEALFIFRPLIKKIKDYNAILQRYALEDSLTGLNNRRAFMNAGEIEIKRAQRDKTPMTTALLDLDHFKKINDTYGHETGDRVLKHFANILKQTFRAGDITGRVGGEEFAIILPKISHKGAITILQRLCDKTASTPCEFKTANGKKDTLSYTVSIGFTGPVIIKDQTIDSLLRQADEGLYKAKEEGRNRLATTDTARINEPF